MRYLKQNTAIQLTVGPALDFEDGVTPLDALTETDVDGVISYDDDDGSVGAHFSFSCTASGGDNDLVAIGHGGMWTLEATAAQTNYTGRMMLCLYDPLQMCPIFHEFQVLAANIYDSLFAGVGPTPDLLDVSVTQLGGGAQSATDLKDFADTGYDPATHAVAEVTKAVGVENNVTATLIDGAITAAKIAAAAIEPAAFHADMRDGANLKVKDDSGNAIAPASTALSNATWTDAKAGHLDAAISGRSSHDAATVKTAIEADGSKLDHLWEMTEDDAGTRRLTENSLEEAPTGGVGWSSDELKQIRDALGVDGDKTAAANGDIQALQTDVTTIAADVAGLGGEAMRGTNGVDTEAMRGTNNASLFDPTLETVDVGKVAGTAIEHDAGYLKVRNEDGSKLATQAVADEIYDAAVLAGGGRGGRVYVAKTGDNAYDGRSWAKAKLTMPAAVAAAGHGWHIAVGVGTFDDGKIDLSALNGVTILGVSRTGTILQNGGGAETETIVLGPGCTTRKLTVTHGSMPGADAILVSGDDCSVEICNVDADCTGIRVDTNKHGLTIDGCFIQAREYGVDIAGTGASTGHALNVIRNSVIEVSLWQSCDCAAVLTCHDLLIEKSLLRATGSANSGSYHIDGLLVARNRVVLRGSRVYSHGSDATPVFGIRTVDSAIVIMSGGGIKTTWTGLDSGDEYDLCNESGVIAVAGVDYDSSKTSGIITDITRLAPDGMDSVEGEESAAGFASKMGQKIDAIYNRMFSKVNRNKETGTLTTYKADGTTPMIEQTTSDDGTDEMIGKGTTP